MSSERRKQIVDKFPQPPLPDASPPSLDKAVTTLVQKRKNILSHDSFLMRLQCFASDAVGPITFLLGELMQGRDIPKDKAIATLQAALCCIDNSSAHLSVERRQCILRQLNPKLVPLAEEVFENDGKLSGDGFGRCAKDRMDAIHSLSSSSMFFDWATPPQECGSNRALGVAEKALHRDSPHTHKEKGNGIDPTHQPGSIPRSKPASARQRLVYRPLQSPSHTNGVLPTCRPSALPP